MSLLFWLLLSFSAGFIGSRFRPGAWYSDLAKPAWNPPNWIFPPVWSILYLMMGIAASLVWKAGPEHRFFPLTLFMIQLVLNALWSWIFFGRKQIKAGLIDIGLLWVSVLATVILFMKVNPLAGKILVPYFMWVSFAAVLNASLWKLNPLPVVSSRLIFDFSKEESADWFSINDGVMGGLSQGRLSSVSASIGLFSGTVSFQNNGGFSSVKSKPGNHDLSAFTRLRLRVQGDGKKYKLRVKTDDQPDGVFYECPFLTLAGKWTAVELPFESFYASYRGSRVADAPPLHGGAIRSFGFLISDRQEGPFELKIDWIKAS